MRTNQESYEFELTLEEKKALFFGNRFIVYDSNGREVYEIIASPNSATLFSSPKNKIVSKITRSARLFSIKKQTYSLYLNNKKIDELEITGYGILKAREGIMASYRWRIEIGANCAFVYDINDSLIAEFHEELGISFDLFKCSMKYHYQNNELPCMFILMYLVCMHQTVKESDQDIDV